MLFQGFPEAPLGGRGASDPLEGCGGVGVRGAHPGIDANRLFIGSQGLVGFAQPIEGVAPFERENGVGRVDALGPLQ